MIKATVKTNAAALLKMDGRVRWSEIATRVKSRVEAIPCESKLKVIVTLEYRRYDLAYTPGVEVALAGEKLPSEWQGSVSAAVWAVVNEEFAHIPF